MQRKVKEQENEEEPYEEQDYRHRKKKSKKSCKEPDLRYLFFLTLDQMHEDVFGKETIYAKKHNVNCAATQKSCSFCQDKLLVNIVKFVMTKGPF